MHRLFIGAAVAALLGTAGAASAGGLYEGEASIKDPVPMAPVAIWSGLYIGGTVGFGTGDTSDRFDIRTEGDAALEEVTDDASAIFGLGFPPTPEGITLLEAFLGNDYDMNGAFYGGLVGYNWQSGSVVLGVEAGLNGTDFDGHVTCANIADCHRQLEYYASVTGRLGYAMDNMMFYGFGGVAWGKVETKTSVLGTPVDDLWTGVDSVGFDNTATHVGWTAGVGLDFALSDRFVVGIEYAHVDLGEKTHAVLTATEEGESIGIYDDVHVSFDVVRFRASYKLWDSAREPIASFK